MIDMKKFYLTSLAALLLVSCGNTQPQNTNEEVEHGNLRRRPRWMVNELGLPQFLDVRMSWNIALNDLHDVESPEEFYLRVRELAKQDPMYELMYQRLKPIVNAAFNVDENGHFINNQTEVYADDAYGIFA